MAYLADHIEQEVATLSAAGHTGALRHRSIHDTAMPAIRMYPVAPARGSLSSAAAAVWQAAVPRGAARVRQDRQRRATATEAIARAAVPAAVQGAVTPADVLIADSTAMMLETFLLHIGAAAGTVALVPGLLLSPFHNLLNVLTSFGVSLVPFDFDVDTMEADVSGMRAALAQPARHGKSGRTAHARTLEGTQPILLLVGIRGRFFRNAVDIYTLANEKACAVVSVHAPTLSGPDPASSGDGNGGGTERGSTMRSGAAPSLHITAFDGPGSLGGAVAFSPQPSTTAAVKEGLQRLPPASAAATWKRLAAHVCNVLLSERLDYGSTVWTLALLSRAARTARELLLRGKAQLMAPMRGDSATAGSRRGSAVKADGETVAGAASALDVAREEAMDWMYDLLANAHSSWYPADASHTARSSAWRDGAMAAVAGAASVARQAVSALAAAPERGGQSAPTRIKQTRAELISPLLRLSSSSHGARPASTGTPGPTSAQMSPSTLEWLRKLVRDQQRHQDADLLCLWSFLYNLPSYVNVVSAGEAQRPLACVEVGATSVVLRAECPALVVRQLQRAGFGALLARPVAFAPDSNIVSSIGGGGGQAAARAVPSVPNVNGVLYVPTCQRCATAAKQLCFLPLSPAMTPADHQLLIDLLSEMPRPWMTRTAQPVSPVTSGQHQRTDGKNFSNADRPYNTPEVRALLLAVSRRHISKGAGPAAGGGDGDLDRNVKAAVRSLLRGRHPVFTYLMYGTTAARILVAKM